MSEIVRERVVRWEDPLARPMPETLSGLEILRALLRGDLNYPPMASLVGYALVEVDEGRAVIESTPAEYHYNHISSAHGGFALTLLDSALTCAVLSTLPAGVGCTTTDVQVRFIRGMSKDTGPVRCEAKTVHTGRSTAIAEARLTDGAGKLIATGTTACAILRPREASAR